MYIYIYVYVAEGRGDAGFMWPLGDPSLAQRPAQLISLDQVPRPSSAELGSGGNWTTPGASKNREIKMAFTKC